MLLITSLRQQHEEVSRTVFKKKDGVKKRMEKSDGSIYVQQGLCFTYLFIFYYYYIMAKNPKE